MLDSANNLRLEIKITCMARDWMFGLESCICRLNNHYSYHYYLSYQKDSAVILVVSGWEY
jgi:hypothetical protein